MEFVEAGVAPGGFVVFDLLEFGAEVVQEKGPDDFHDIFLGGVVSAKLAAFRGLHDFLEKRTENGGGDFFPAETAGTEQSIAHVDIEIGGD